MAHWTTQDGKNLHFGALPQTAKPRVRLAPFLTSDEPDIPPVSADWMEGVGDWGVLGNDNYGDCGEAGMAHLLMANAVYGGHGQIEFTTDNVLDAYSKATGFNKNDPNSDQGTVLQDFCNFMLKTGMEDASGNVHKITAFAQVDVSNLDEVDRALDLFGGLYTGFSVYEFAMTEFENGKQWTEHKKRGSLEGRHCVPVLRVHRTESREHHNVVTWGQNQGVGRQFFVNYFSEAWVAVTPEWVDVNGKSPSGLDLQGLMDEVHRLQGI